MKYLVMFLVSCFVLGLVYAEDLLYVDHKTQLLTTEVIDGEGNHIYTITVTPEQYKILEWQYISLLQEIDDFVALRVNNCSDRMLIKLSETTPMKKLGKLTKQEKKNLIKNSKLKTRVERDEEAVRRLNP